MLRASIRDLLRVYAAHGWRMAVGQFVVGVVSAVVMLAALALLANTAPAAAQSMTFAQLIGAVLVVVGLALLLMVPVVVAGYAAIVVNADEALAGRRVRLFRALLRGMRRAVPLGLALLLALLVPVALLAASPLVVVGALLGLALTPLVRLLQRRRPEVLGRWPAPRALLVAAIPFALAVRETARALLLFPAAVLEGVGARRAFRIAGELVCGRRGRVLALAALGVVTTVGLGLLVSWGVQQLWGDAAAQGAQLIQFVLLPITLTALTAFYRRAAGPDGRVLAAGEAPAPSVRRTRAATAMARVAIATAAALVVTLVSPFSPVAASASVGEGVIHVTSSADTLDAGALAAQRASCEANGPDCTLRAALAVAQDAALAGAGDLAVRFDTSMRVELVGGILVNTNDETATGTRLTIDGAGHAVDIVADYTRIFEIYGHRAVVISGLGLSGGYGDGGALAVNGSSVTIVDSTFSGNTSGNNGGAVYSYAPLTVVDSTFSGNSAGFFRTGADIYALANLTVTNSTFVDSAMGASLATGGGVVLTLRNSVIARDAGGGGTAACQGFSGLSTGSGNVVPNSDTTCPGVAASPSLSGSAVGRLVGPLERRGAALVHPVLSAALLGVGTGCPATDQTGRTRPANGCAAGAAEFDPRSVTTVATSGTPSLQGSFVTFTATVAALTETGALPQGTVQFLADGTAIESPQPLYPTGSTPPFSAAATLSTATLAAGSHAITAVFTPAPGTAFAPSTSAAVTQEVINPVVLTASPTVSTQGEDVTLRVQVTAGTGTVAVRDVTDGTPGTTIASGLTLVDGTAEFTTGTLPLGDRLLVADYSGDGEHDAASSPQATVRVRPASTVALSIDRSSAPYGAPVEFTATVETSGGAPVADGEVEILFDGNRWLGPLPVTDGVASARIDWAPAGSYTVTARYLGGAADGVGVSNGEPLAVTAAPTAVTGAVITPSTPQYGNPLDITVTVRTTGSSTADPAGTVSVTPDGGTPVTAEIVADGVRDGTATATVRIPGTLAAGAHTLDVAFAPSAGSQNFQPATLPTLHQTIGLAATRVALTSLSPSVAWGDLPVLLATVEATGSDAVPASGTVTFRNGAGAVIGTATLGAGGTTSLVVSSTVLGLGTHDLTATFEGTGDFAASAASDPFVLTVGRAPTTTVVTSPGTVVFGSGYVVGVRLDAGSATVTGGLTVELVELQGGGAERSLGTASLASGEGTLVAAVAGDPAPMLAPGTHHLEARFAGSAQLAGSTTAFDVTVLAASTTTSLSLDRTTLRYGQSVQATATVANVGSGSTGLLPAGDVVFRFGGVEVGRVPASALVASGLGTVTATLPVPLAFVSSADFVAAFEPATGFASSVSGATLVTVGPATTAVQVSLTPAPYGGSVQASARVTVADGGPGLTPTGLVYFMVNGGDWSLGGPIDGDGRSTLPGGIPVTMAGSYTVRAWYVPAAGDNRFTAGVPENSQYGVATITIASETPVVAVAGWPTVDVPYGAPTVSLTVTVTGNGIPPSGEVQLHRAGTNVAFGDPATLVASGAHSATATLRLPVLPLGTESLAVVYSGGGGVYTGTASDAATVTTVPAFTTTTLTSSTRDGWGVTQPGVVGIVHGYTAKVASAGLPATSGMVNFTTDGGTVSLGAVSLASDGTATLYMTPSREWSGDVTATYTPFDTNLGSSSGTLAHSWVHVPTRVQLSLGSMHVGTGTTATVTVSADTGWGGAVPSVAPQGSVTISGSAGGSCVAALTPVVGQPTFTTGSCVLPSPAAAGAQTVTASYTGGGSWAPGTGSLGVSVFAGEPSITFGSSVSTDWIGLDTVRLSWQILGPTADGVQVTVLRDTTTTVCTSPARTGYCDYTFEAGSSGSRIGTRFDLRYAGDADWGMKWATMAGTLASCVPLGSITVVQGAGTIVPQTTPNCANGNGYIAGTLAMWTVDHSSDTVIGGVTPVGAATVGGDLLQTTAHPSRSPISFGVQLVPRCVPMQLGAGVQALERPNCGPGTAWRQQPGGWYAGDMLAGTVLHLTGNLQNRTPQQFLGWTGDVPEADRGKNPIEYTVTARPYGAPNLVYADFAPVCHPISFAPNSSLGFEVTSGTPCTDGRTGAPGYLASTYTTVQVSAKVDHAYVSSVTAVNSAGRTASIAERGGTVRVQSIRIYMDDAVTVGGSLGTCVPFTSRVEGVSFATGLEMGSVRMTPASNCPTTEPGWYLPNSTVRVEGVPSHWGYSFLGWSGLTGKYPGSSWDSVQIGETGGEIVGSFGQPGSCVPFTITVVPAGALEVSYEVQNSLGRNGCPVGTYDARMVDTYVGDGGVPITVTAKPTGATGPNTVIGIAWTTKKFRASTGEIFPVDRSTPIPASSQTIYSYGATNVTVYACERIYAEVALISPNGTVHRGENSADSDLVQVSPTPNCPIPGRAAYTIGSEVYLNAGGDPHGYRFLGWSGDLTSSDAQPPAPLAMNGAKSAASVTASYQVTCYQLTSNWASVVPDPAPNCPDAPASEHRWIGGTVVTLQATSEGGNLFREWKGGPEAVDGVFAAVAMNSDRTVTAYFSSKSAGEAIVSAFTSIGDALAVAAKKGVGVAAAVVSGIVAGSNPLFVAASAIAGIGAALRFITDKLGVQGAALDGILSVTDAVGTAMELMTAPFQCGVEWSGSTGNATPSGGGSTSVGGAVGSAIAGQLNDRAAAQSQSLASQLVNRFYGAEAAQQAQAAQGAAKTFGRVAAVGLAVYQQVSSGNVGWDSSAQAAWTDGSAYNACMARVLGKIPGVPAPPSTNFDWNTMTPIKPGDPRYVAP